MQKSIVLSPDLELRTYLLDDAEALLNLTIANEEHLQKWLPWVEKRRTKKSVEEFIALSQMGLYAQKNHYFGIWQEGRLIGEVSNTETSSFHRRTAIGYWLDEASMGKGIMTRSVKSLIHFLFESLMMNRVEIRVAPNNKPSRKIPERLGFTEEGILRRVEHVGDQYLDHVVYGLLHPEWKAYESHFSESL